MHGKIRFGMAELPTGLRRASLVEELIHPFEDRVSIRTSNPLPARARRITISFTIDIFRGMAGPETHVGVSDHFFFIYQLIFR